MLKIGGFKLLLTNTNRCEVKARKTYAKMMPTLRNFMHKSSPTLMNIPCNNYYKINDGELLTIGKARVNKSKQIGNLRAKGRPRCYFWFGLAESAGRAEALELVKDANVSPALAPRTGAADSSSHDKRQSPPPLVSGRSCVECGVLYADILFLTISCRS